ncbi:hypothetical protein EB796_010183 [Bugula neritina]|uniref:Dynein heavy chain linker domain-containing protein n=1 Tax=Bugula neritina TaxID=10212 RepID=A0A7J7K0S4_BUGNE|nr:hypothetical protein EB796_010183 [Bugula neritina]
MKAALTHCHKSLLHQLARRLQKFPRFYFLSLEDVLHIVCNGYDLRQINNYIIKLFENIGELTYTEPDESEKNLFEITGVKSVLGEHLPLKQAIVCEGQIESWLPLLLSGITSALQTQLAVVMGAEVPLEDVPKKKAIRSAGSRKIVVHSSQGSRPTSKQKPMGKLPGSRAGRKAEDKRAQSQSRSKFQLRRLRLSRGPWTM